MPDNPPPSGPPVSSRLHPAVSKAIVALAIWLALSIWWGFGGDGYADYLLTVVSGFLFIAMLLTFALWRIWWRHPGTHGSATARGDREPLQAWLSGEFETWQGRLEGHGRSGRDPAADRSSRLRHDDFRHPPARHHAWRLRRVSGAAPSPHGWAMEGSRRM